MNDDILKLLDDALQADSVIDVSDADADAILMQSPECSEESLQRMRRIFVEKALSGINRVPVTEAENTPFGRWIEKIRKKASLSSESIEKALGKRSPYIERLETGALMPWKLPASDVAELVGLFRIHIKALRQMVLASLAVNQTPLAGDVIARSHGGKVSQERGDSTKRALDMFLARNSKIVEITPEIELWLKGVTEHLERSNLASLI
jgi:hypothetical protein